MRIHFGITEESRRQHQKELEKLDKKLKSYGLNELSFGLYEGIIDEGDFSCAAMWVLTYPFIADEGLFYNIWYDEENLEKGDMMAAHKRTVKKVKSMKSLKKEYNDLLKEAGLPIESL